MALAVLAAASVVGALSFEALRMPVDASVAPSAVRNLTAQISGDQATVSWAAPTTGPVGRYKVDAVLDGSDYGERIAGPTATSITWDRIPFGHSIQFIVTPIGLDSAGGASGPAGPAWETGAVTASNSYCGAGDCVVVDPGIPEGIESHPGSGLIHGTGDPPANPSQALVARLQLDSWRLRADSDSFAYATAQVPSSQLIEVISDAWDDQYRAWLGGAQDPWANWSTYTNFVQGQVRYAMAQGRDPYWEIQNEPQSYDYSRLQPPNRSRVEQQYLKAYQAIRAVNPNARIIGPSIAWTYEDSSALIDMKTFIPLAAANGMQFAAIAWHDNCCDSDSGWRLPYYQSPEVIRDHAEMLQELIRENPGIGSPVLFADEDSSSSGQFSPGWAASYFAEEERAGLALADRTCWRYPGDSSQQQMVADCSGPNLDELLAKNTQTPLASYWAMVDYASMTGSKAWSASSDPDVSSLAVTDGSGTTRILLGRHQTCSGWTSGQGACPVTVPPATIGSTVTALVPLGATSAVVTVQQIADTMTPMANPPASIASTAPVTGGAVRVSIPAMGDGEAYFVTVTPNSTAGSYPASGN